jgi:hypothetical protein
MRLRPALPLLALLASLVAPEGVRAQHAMPVGPRPLHLRLAEADVVAIATVAEVGEGRVALRDAAVLRGEAPAAFEIKRAPSLEIPYAVGLTLLLPLRGVRPPYVLVDDARELVVLRDEAAAAAWREALPALLAAGGEREALLDVYLGWLDGGEDGLRDAAGSALLDPRAELVPVSPERALERAGVALDPAFPATTRRVSAVLAGARPEGARALLAALHDAKADPQVAEAALRSGQQLADEAFEEALLAGLAHDSPEVRRAAVRATVASGSATARARLSDLSAHDPDEGVRRDAQKALHGG